MRAKKIMYSYNNKQRVLVYKIDDVKKRLPGMLIF